MQEVQKGNLDYQIIENKTSDEFAQLNHSFNEMISEIHHLKISVYEEQLKRQKSDMLNLTLQLRPHFLINSLNMLYNFIAEGSLTHAQNLITYSMDYLRYIIKVDNNFVPLEDELSHIQSYIKIQQLRYGDILTYECHCDSFASEFSIPPCLLQNFIENSVKYALHYQEVTEISVNVDYAEIDGTPFAQIIISDNGPGFSASIIEDINKGISITDDYGLVHIGISNSLSRIQFLYKNQANWKLYNNTKGAVIELYLPYL